jgi:hypothetical protein
VHHSRACSSLICVAWHHTSQCLLWSGVREHATNLGPDAIYRAASASRLGGAGGRFRDARTAYR